MVGKNPYAQYNNSKILTASPAELTLMLYEGAIKFCNIAIMGIEQNEYFDRVYVYILQRLFEANIKKDKEILEEVLTHLRSMRDTWKEVMRVNRERGVG